MCEIMAGAMAVGSGRSSRKGGILNSMLATVIDLAS